MSRTAHICGCLALALAGLVVPDGRAQTTGVAGMVGYALEHLVSGASATVEVGGTAYRVTPLRSWKSVSGHWCRRYEMSVARPGSAPRRSEATRCRQDGFWRAPAGE